MGRILVVNAGSTSLKLSTVAEDGTSEGLESLADAPHDVSAVGHRIVHGGMRFRHAVVVDDGVRDALGELAPLHAEVGLRALDDARRSLPAIPHVAVFDTAFHATMPDVAATYAVPRRWREGFGIRRYGFHGLAVAWVAEQVRARRLVACHLGGGCSVTGVLDGRSVDTTMGFSPLEGPPMATRSGSVDPGALLYLLRERHATDEEIERVLEHESGLSALGGLDDPLGFAIFAYRIAQAVAAIAVALGGVDAIAFSGGIGENRDDVRRAVLERLGFLGEVRVEVVHAREDVVIARALRGVLAGATAIRDPS